MEAARVENMRSTRTGRPVANQFLVLTAAGVYFQSYRTVIAFRDLDGRVTLDRDAWDYSKTTGRYRNQFLREGIKETRKKIESGEYAMDDLNK